MDALRHCFPPNLRQYLNELPETLDETYDRILKGISKAQRNNAHRLLQCLTVAVRPLLVEELAELLAFDFQASMAGGIPTLKEDWRWDDQEEAVLSTCSSLIVITPRDDTRIVQFSHFSVKEYLTSSRLARSPLGEVSRFRIDLEPAHTIMVQACLATMLRLDENAGKSYANGSPLVKYAARYWVNHAQIEEVTSRVREGMDDLFDNSKPHFAAWLQVYDIDEEWFPFSRVKQDGLGSPLYYAAFCGFYKLTESLIMKHPELVNARGGGIFAPLQAALYKRHFGVANLLYRHGAVVEVLSPGKETPLHQASGSGYVDIMRWLLDHGADPNARTAYCYTPLFYATSQLEAVQVLIEYDVDINSQLDNGETPLYSVFTHGRSGSEEQMTDIARRLLEHGADPNIRKKDHSTTMLHRASSCGWLEAMRLLLSYGARVDEKDRDGMTPFQVAASKRYDEITKLLLEYGAVPQS